MSADIGYSGLFAKESQVLRPDHWAFPANPLIAQAVFKALTVTSCILGPERWSNGENQPWRLALKLLI